MFKQITVIAKNKLITTEVHAHSAYRLSQAKTVKDIPNSAYQEVLTDETNDIPTPPEKVQWLYTGVKKISKLRSCVKVEVFVLAHEALIVFMVKQHSTELEKTNNKQTNSMYVIY